MAPDGAERVQMELQATLKWGGNSVSNV